MKEDPVAEPTERGPVVVADGEAWIRAGSGALARALSAVLSEPSARASLVLSGGSTPGPVYAGLAREAEISWSRVDVFFADERMVPPDHPESNFRLVRETLTGTLGADAPTLHFAGEASGHSSLDSVAEWYAARLPRPVDVLVLGIGQDGHIASLFPGDRRVVNQGAHPAVLPVLRAPKPPPRRVTIAPRVIREARHTVVLARGAGKATAVRAALHGPWDPQSCPAQLARAGTWILDSAAAAGLHTPPPSASPAS